jgi:hypothetical protein
VAEIDGVERQKRRESLLEASLRIFGCGGRI